MELRGITMKVCERCESMIDGRDGENRCTRCEGLAERKRITNAKAKVRRDSIRSAMESLGLVRVRGALGGIYWE